MSSFRHGLFLQQWSPLRRFINGKPGYWYDASDLSSQFQDDAGTTPVTAVGQSVGKVLDKSGRGNHIIQATEASKPILRQNSAGGFYWETDGVAQHWLSAAAVNFSTIDKISTIVGVQATDLTTGTIGIVCNLGGTGFSHFSIQAPTTVSGQIAFNASGASGTESPAEGSLASPLAAVITGQANLAANRSVLRRDGAQRASSAVATGGGNFASATLGIARQANAASRFFGGRIYQAICFGEYVDEATLLKAERFVMRKMVRTF